MRSLSQSRYFVSSATIMAAVAIMLLTGSCRKDEKISPDETQPPFYTLPQGNHPYDNSIVDFHTKYGSFILYKFNKGDYTWNLTSSALLHATQPDENKVGDALSFLMDYIFGNYSESFLKKSLPYKIVLPGAMYPLVVNTKGGYDTTWSAPVLASGGYNYVTLAVADTITKMTAGAKKQLRADFNYFFWRRALNVQAVEYPTGFTTLINYSLANPGTYKDHGMLSMFTPFTNQALWTPADDLQCYVREITSKTTAQFANAYLVPSYDTKGFVKKKYDLITAYYKDKYGLDLQAMGDAQ